MTIESDISELPSTKKFNYLNNRDILKEIHKSKIAFSEYISKDYEDYDIIVKDVNEILLTAIQDQARITRATRLSVKAYELSLDNDSVASRISKYKLAEFKVCPSTIAANEIVYRVLTFDHIPLAPGRKKNPKKVADKHVKLNFHPYKHYIIESDSIKEVGRSHSKNGVFSLYKGNMTNKLASMIMLLVNRYAQRANWRGYSYLDEMKGAALLQLSHVALQFDEDKSDNPFSYYSLILETSFTKVLNTEKRNQDIRDNMLLHSGASPSFSKQLAYELEIRAARDQSKFIKE